jgi:putative ABC transport system permease protein
MHPPKLEDPGRYVSDRVAWTAVLSDPDLIIADPMFLQTGGPPGFNVRIGDRLTVNDPISGASHEVTVAALSTSDGLIANGMLYGWDSAHLLFGDRLVASRTYMTLAPGTNADTFASHLQTQFISNGTEAFSIAALMDEALTMTRQIFQLFQGYLAMGLLVGIAGIAVVMVRAVPRAAPPDRDAPRAGLSRAVRGPKFRDRSGIRGATRYGDRRAARAAHALHDRRSL